MSWELTSGVEESIERFNLKKGGEMMWKE